MCDAVTAAAQHPKAFINKIDTEKRTSVMLSCRCHCIVVARAVVVVVAFKVSQTTKQLFAKKKEKKISNDANEYFSRATTAVAGTYNNNTISISTLCEYFQWTDELMTELRVCVSRS